MTDRPNILVISREPEEAAMIQGILGRRARLCMVTNSDSVQNLLATGEVDIVFCGGSEPEWMMFLAEVSLTQPDLPVIVFSRTAGEREWIKALDAGAFDLMGAPFQEAAVWSVLEHAMATVEARKLHPPQPRVAKATNAGGVRQDSRLPAVA